MKGYAYVAAYCVTKHGVIGLTHTLVLETVKNGVVVVEAISQGYTKTALTEGEIENIANSVYYLRYLQVSGFPLFWK